MSLIYKLTEIIDDCRTEYQQLKEEIAEGYIRTFKIEEVYGESSLAEKNILAWGDNLDWMKYLCFENQVYGKVKLIYADPPFFSKADYKMQVKIHSKGAEGTVKVKQTVYTDTWNEGIEAYLRMICIRLLVMRDLLTEDGCIFMHLDWHMVHYVKILMDEIFGMDNFVNEIVWNYKSGGTSSRHFARKHDTLLFYGKSSQYYFQAQKEKSYNRGFKPYRFKGVEEFQDETGWYTLVNMKDVWQMDMVGRTSSERTGYATQKPELLLERILKSCTKAGDLCADFFGGSGTLAATADKMGRNWITCDIGKSAAAGIKKRVLQKKASFIVLRESFNAESMSDVQVQIKKQDEKYSAELKSYHLKEEYINTFGEKERELIHKLIHTDSLSLIDYWSIDFNFDGKIHKPQCVMIREKESLEKYTEGISATGMIQACSTDVFGNVLYKTFKYAME